MDGESSASGAADDKPDQGNTNPANGNSVENHNSQSGDMTSSVLSPSCCTIEDSTGSKKLVKRKEKLTDNNKRNQKKCGKFWSLWSKKRSSDGEKCESESLCDDVSDESVAISCLCTGLKRSPSQVKVIPELPVVEEVRGNGNDTVNPTGEIFVNSRDVPVGFLPSELIQRNQNSELFFLRQSSQVPPGFPHLSCGAGATIGPGMALVTVSGATSMNPSWSGEARTFQSFPCDPNVVVSVAVDDDCLGNEQKMLMRIPQTIHTQVDYIHCLVPDLKKITDCSYYWGVMDRYEAEHLLENRPEGTFLLRDSAQEEFLFSVSFRRYSRSLHARVEQWKHMFSFDSHDPSVYASRSVCGLIEHYKDPACCMFFEPMLTLPLVRTFPFSLQYLCRAAICSMTSYDGISYLPLPKSLHQFLQYYHYKQKVRVRQFEAGHHR